MFWYVYVLKYAKKNEHQHFVEHHIAVLFDTTRFTQHRASSGAIVCKNNREYSKKSSTNQWYNYTYNDNI